MIDKAKLFDIIYESGDLLLVGLDGEGRFVLVNPAFERLSGFKEEEILGRHFLELPFSDRLRRRLAAVSREAQGGGIPVRLEFPLPAAAGEERIIVWTIIPVEGERGRPDLFLALGRDATEIRRWQRELVRKEEHFRLLVENSQDLVTVVKPDGKIMYVSPSVRNLLGYHPDELVGEDALRFVHPEDLETARANLRLAAESEGVRRYSLQRIRHKNGTWKYHEASAFNLLHHPAIRGIVINSRDITDRKRLEERYQSLYSTMQEGMALHEIIYDEKGDAVDYVILDVNPAYEAILGIEREKAVGARASLLYGTGEPPYIDIFAEVAQTGKPARFETYFAPMGRYFSISVFSPEKGKSATVFFDITDRKQAEEALRRSEEMYRATFESTGSAMFLIDDRGEIVRANREVEKLLGYTPEELVGRKKYTEYIHPDDLPKVKEEARKMIKGGAELPVTYECRVYRKSGGIAHTLVTVGMFPGLDLSVVSLIDITDRKRAEEALRRSEEMYRATFETTGTAMFLVERDATVSHVNREMEKIFGYTREEVVGRMRYMELLMPEEVPKVKAYSLGLLRGELRSPLQYEVRARHKSGRPIDALVTVSMIPGLDQSVISVVDISEKKKYELELERRAEELRDFLDVAAHELRHPSVLVKGYAATLEKRYELLDEDTRMQALEAVQQGTDRLVKVVEELLDLSRIERGRLQVSLERREVEPVLCRAVDEMAARTMDHELELRVAGDLGEARVDEERLVRLMVILLDNAVKYSPPGTTVEIAAERKGDEIVVSVADRGKGIPEGDRERIFERFYQGEDTRHHGGPGLGLGLYIGRRIVEAHGGRIWCEEREGGGSIFRFTLPAGEET
jgi:PAS domain S-box-containing protein